MTQADKTVSGFVGIVICVVVGIVSEKTDFDPGQFIGLVGGILFTVGVFKTVFFTPSDDKSSELPTDELKSLMQRMSDIQEIVISLDERLKRMEGTGHAIPEEPKP